MLQPDPLQAHQPSACMPAWQYAPHIRMDDSSTFVNPLHEGSSEWISPYDFSPETAIPPPPPGIDGASVSLRVRDRGYRIALAVLVVLVLALGFLEMMQVTKYASEMTGSTQHTIARPQTVPTMTVTPGTIKEHATLMCGMCNDPVHTTLTSIAVDTTNHRLIFNVTLQNVSGAQQIDYFAEFSLHDPFGNAYEGTGNLNTDFFLDAGQTAMKTEIFSFLPRPGVSYVLSARLGLSGLTYDLLPLTF
jgi:hypothetical protein